MPSTNAVKASRDKFRRNRFMLSRGRSAGGGAPGLAVYGWVGFLSPGASRRLRVIPRLLPGYGKTPRILGNSWLWSRSQQAATLLASPHNAAGIHGKDAPGIRSKKKSGERPGA